MADLWDLFVDPTGPDPLVIRCGDAIEVVLPDEPLQLLFEAVGMPGRDGADGGGADIEAVAAADMPAGSPVFIDRTTGRFAFADASWKPAAFVAGLLRGVGSQGFVAAAAVRQLTLGDWSQVTGTAQLAPGQNYFLADGGGLTPVPPASACVVLVGKALNSATLLIDPQPPIQL